MTIVLQNKFWGLKVNDQGFEVGLTFNQVPAELVIPFSAITAFVDPAVNFALQFQVQGAGEEPEPHEAAENDGPTNEDGRSEEHTSELQSLISISYAVFCLKKKKKK